ncbi:precorrin-3B C(17)-methyltransferase [Marivibrio halodurans]|uniref:Precorrin-3B C(17)-methyltransferase n=1 Tax=Marivibrio halodurans TaxID=2039722 RepID=A0A8J7S426_9PROT|nr:precorrin-3B C(17)-methyltransferase [Marivibrio halodurans]MBP5858178.1 precorrin-3B C(17)-methyltransferase [Marivibrio halodurans]
MIDESDDPVILALTAGGEALAHRLVAALGGGTVHGRVGRVGRADYHFDKTTKYLADLFREGRPIVALCAAGIVIRALAPHLGDKRAEPPVLALSEDGASVVPLLGGHRGANRLARRIADLLGGHAAVTTAGEVALGLALDDPPPGWHVANPEAAKDIAAALLAGESVRLTRAAGPGDWPILPDGGTTDDAPYHIAISDHRPAEDASATLHIHPPSLAIGVGCERLAPAQGLVDLARETLAEAGLADAAVAAIGSIDLKADEPAMAALSRALDRPLRLFPAAALEAETPRLANPSETVFREVGCHGVAEASALALAGPGASLVVPKVKRDGYTLAIARAADGMAVDPARGRARGHLSVVGIGPGDAAWRTAEAVSALRRAEVVVGYGLYLDLARDLIGGKPTHESALGAEEARAAKALALAAEGRDVALVCSGDPGIYALATLVMELVEKSGSRAERAVALTVVPGISAFQAAAARLGAPMGHDFCLISLSDLLTPRDTIMQRLEAAATGDFVTAFYNPQSQRRRTLLPEAKRILATHRPPETPVAICRSLGRPEEAIDLVTLSDFDPETVDMLTLVLIGNSQSRAFDQAGTPRLFTPRGYARKRGEANP